MPVLQWRSALGRRLRKVADLLDPARGAADAPGQGEQASPHSAPPGIGAGTPGRRLDLDNAPEHWAERVRAAALSEGVGTPIEVPVGGSTGAPGSRPRRYRRWRRRRTETGTDVRPRLHPPAARLAARVLERPADVSRDPGTPATPTPAGEREPASPSKSSSPAPEPVRGAQADDGTGVRPSPQPAPDPVASPTGGGRALPDDNRTVSGASRPGGVRPRTGVPAGAAGAADGRLLLPFPDVPAPGTQTASSATGAGYAPAPSPPGPSAPSLSRPARQGDADPASRVTLLGAARVDVSPPTDSPASSPVPPTARPSSRRSDAESGRSNPPEASLPGGTVRLPEHSRAAPGGAAAPDSPPSRPSVPPAHDDPWPQLPLRAHPPTVVVPAPQLEAFHRRALRLAREQAAV